MGRNFTFDAARYLATGSAGIADITGQQITQAGWVKMPSIPDWMCFLGKYQYTIGMTSGLSTFATVKDGGGEDLMYGNNPSTGVWHHLCYTRDATTARLWTDGVVVGTVASTRAMASLGTVVYVGRDYGGFPWNGDVAEVALWNVALNAGEVYALASGISPLLVRLGSLRAYWPLGLSSPDANLAAPLANLFQNGTPNPVSTTNPVGGRWAMAAGAGG